MLRKTRKEQKEETRLRLLESGIQLFGEKGFLGTTMGDIGRLSAVSHGTVFLHFPSRDDLIIAVLDEFGRRLSSAFDVLAGSQLTIYGVLKAHLQALESFESLYRNLIQEETHLPKNVRSMLYSLHAAVSYRLFLAVEADMQRGLFKTMERHLLFNTWISLVHYYLAHQELFSPEGSVIRAKGDELLQHFINLIRTERTDMSSNKCQSCGSCGMPLKEAKDFALGDFNSSFCSHCTDETGQLLPYQQIFEGTVAYFIQSQGIDRQAAEAMTQSLLATMPAWNA